MSEEIKDIMDALENNELKNDGFWGRACSRLSQQLQACKEENENLTKKVRNQSLKITDLYHILSENEHYIKVECPKEFEEIVQENVILTQQNKQMRENINNIKNLCSEDWEDMTVDKFQNQLLQTLKGGE